MAKTRYMIVSGASVVVVRDGKRKSIMPGGGDDFTEGEIKSINGAVPGALRKAINETRTPSPDSDDDDDGDAAEKKAAKAEKPAKAPKKAAKPAKTEKPADDDKSDDDDDEDGDI